MKLSVKMKQLIEKFCLNSVLDSILQATTYDKLLLQFSNQCVYKANNAKTKKLRKQWYHIARIFHRAYDEILLEKTKKKVFKVVRRDFYLCPKCKKRFQVDAARELNCKYDMDKRFCVVTCPNCSFSE